VLWPTMRRRPARPVKPGWVRLAKWTLPAKVEDHRADRLAEAVAEPLDIEATGTEQP